MALPLVSCISNKPTVANVSTCTPPLDIQKSKLVDTISFDYRYGITCNSIVVSLSSTISFPWASYLVLYPVNNL